MQENLCELLWNIVEDWDNRGINKEAERIIKRNMQLLEQLFEGSNKSYNVERKIGNC